VSRSQAKGHFLDGSGSLCKVMSYSVVDSDIPSLMASFSSCSISERGCVRFHQKLRRTLLALYGQ